MPARLYRDHGLRCYGGVNPNVPPSPEPWTKRPLEYVAFWQALGFVLLICVIWTAHVLNLSSSVYQISAAEAWAWHRSRLELHQADYDPRVLARIRSGSGVSAADYIDRLQARRRWIAQVEASAAGIDAFICPTVPVVAPPLQPLLHDDEAFFATNALLLRNPSVVNYLDGCALSLPCQAADELPVGLMVWAPALHDDTVLDVSLAIERALDGAGR